MKEQFIHASEIAEVMGVSVGRAYKYVREMNEELAAGGYLITSGKVPRKFFQKKYYGYEDNS